MRASKNLETETGGMPTPKNQKKEIARGRSEKRILGPVLTRHHEKGHYPYIGAVSLNYFVDHHKERGRDRF